MSLIALVALAAFWAGRFLNPALSQPTGRGAKATPDSVVEQLWLGLAEPGNPPLVAFSNPAYLANQRGQLMVYTESGTLPFGTTIPDSRARKIDVIPGSGPFY